MDIDFQYLADPSEAPLALRQRQAQMVQCELVLPVVFWLLYFEKTFWDFLWFFFFVIFGFIIFYFLINFFFNFLFFFKFLLFFFLFSEIIVFLLSFFKLFLFIVVNIWIPHEV